MDEQRADFPQVSLDLQHWNNISACMAPWHEYNHSKAERSEREALLREIIPVLHEIISFELTPRQKEVMLLYYMRQQTQCSTANILGITQPTVSQHLIGKKRNGKSIGGAINRIRKKILQSENLKYTSFDSMYVLNALKLLLNPSITRRKSNDQLKKLLQSP